MPIENPSPCESDAREAAGRAMRFVHGGWVGLLFGLTTALAAQGQAWPMAQGGAFVKLSASRVTAAEQWDFDGTVKPYADGVSGDAFFDRSVYLYAEYGLTDLVTLVALVPWKRIEVRDARFAFTAEGLGSVRLGVRIGLKPLVGLTAEGQALALNLALTLPTGYTRNRSPALGPGQADAEAVVGYGLSLYPWPAYAQVGLGLRVRSGVYALSTAIACPPLGAATCVDDARPDYDEEWLLHAELGVSLGRWALAQVIGRGTWSNQPPETGFNPINPLPTRQRLLKLGGGLTVYPVRGFGLSVEYFTTPFGRNTIRSADLFLGLSLRI